jgi:HAE1 family hydrophobic/amphiphilic exporter-1
MGSLVVALFFIAPHIKVEFTPQDDQGKIRVKIELPTNVNVRETDRITKKIEEVISNKKDFPEVRSVFTSVGAEAGSLISSGAQGPEYASIDIDIGQRGERKKSVFEIGNIMTEKFSQIPYDITVTYPKSLGGGDVPVQIEVAGNRFQMKELLEIAEKVKKIAENTPGTIDVSMSWKEGRPETKVIMDRVKLASTNFTVGYIGNILRTSVAGNTDIKYREFGEEYDIRVRLQEKYRKESIQTGDIYIGDIKGKPVYVKNVAELVTKPAPNNIDHRNKQLAIIVTSELAEGAAIGNIQKEINKAIAKDLTLPIGISVKFGGEAKRMGESFGFMLQAIVLAIILVYLVMASIFESYVNPFIIMFALPQAMVGAFLALYLTGSALSIFSMIGFIMLIGLVGKNAILLIDYTNTLRGRGMERDEALKEAGPTRLRPILMTTIALIFALVPVALGLGSGAELRQPMSIAVIGGLILSTMLTLLVIPVLYAQFDDLMIWFDKLKKRYSSTAG